MAFFALRSHASVSESLVVRCLDMRGEGRRTVDRASEEVPRQFQVVGMRCSGQDAIATWLALQCPDATFFINDVQPGQSVADRLVNPDPSDRCYVDGQPVSAPLSRPIDNVICNYEDLRVEETPEPQSAESGRLHRILVLRDPCNLFASRYFFWVRMPVQALRWRWDDRDLWMNHAEHYLSMEGQTGSNWVTVNFNRWAVDRDYRATLALKLDLVFSDAGYREVGHVGSSFDSHRFHGHAERMEVDRLWQRVASVPEYVELMHDERLRDQGRRIFGVLDGVDRLTHSSPPRIVPSLSQVQHLLTAGFVQEAHDLAVRLVHEEQQNADAWFLLAGINAQLGSMEDLIACCRRVIHLQSVHLGAWYNLAVALQSTGNRLEAIDAYYHVLALKPDYAAAHANLGLVLHDMGEYEKAAQHCGEALRWNPRLVQAHNTRGLIYRKQGRSQEAIACFEQVLQSQPNSAAGHCNLGLLYHDLAQWNTAIGHFESALEVLPDFTEARVGLADAQRASGNPEAALEGYRRALRERPTEAPAHGKLGSLLMERGELEQAMVHFHRAGMLKPGDAEVRNNLGTALMFAGRYEEAIDHFKTALAIDPGYASAHWNYSLALLAVGNGEQGWREYEWRWRVGVSEPRQFSQPEWDGGDIPDKTVLLYGEQGFGDAIQFVRFASEMKKRTKKVIVACRNELRRLFSTCPGVDTVCSQDDPSLRFDVHFPLLSLARQLGVSPLSIPGRVPYLTAPNEMRADLRAAITQHEGFRIGIAWSGNTEFRWNMYRSCSLEDFRSIIGISGVRTFSLQKGSTAPKTAWVESVVDLSGYLGDFADTAAAMMQMDLIITTDTSVAHLAGALGCKAWVLLSAAPDWRWLRERSDSPWYPTMRLFRQRQLGDWGNVIQQVASALEDMMAKR